MSTHSAISSREGMATFAFSSFLQGVSQPVESRQVPPRRPSPEAQQRPHHQRPAQRAVLQRGEEGRNGSGRTDIIRSTLHRRRWRCCRTFSPSAQPRGLKTQKPKKQCPSTFNLSRDEVDSNLAPLKTGSNVVEQLSLSHGALRPQPKTSPGKNKNHGNPTTHKLQQFQLNMPPSLSRPLCARENLESVLDSRRRYI